MKFTIRYQYGTYSGTRVVYADDGDEAKRKMWNSLRRAMTLGMAYQSATILSEEEDGDDNDDN